jgi:putative FmdB family regulatory protein
MPVYEFHCDACGADFDALVEDQDQDQPVECPLCHSLETQKELSLYSTYGYGKPVERSCSNEGGEFR